MLSETSRDPLERWAAQNAHLTPIVAKPGKWPLIMRSGETIDVCVGLKKGRAPAVLDNPEIEAWGPNNPDRRGTRARPHPGQAMTGEASFDVVIVGRGETRISAARSIPLIAGAIAVVNVGLSALEGLLARVPSDAALATYDRAKLTYEDQFQRWLRVDGKRYLGKEHEGRLVYEGSPEAVLSQGESCRTGIGPYAYLEIVAEREPRLSEVAVVAQSQAARDAAHHTMMEQFLRQNAETNANLTAAIERLAGAKAR